MAAPHASSAASPSEPSARLASGAAPAWGARVAHLTFSGGIAAEAVAHNKLRAGLTSLGILFGVASVIAMLAIGNGAEQEILEQMKLLGANNIVVTPIVEQKEGPNEKDGAKSQPKRFTPGLSALDAAAIGRAIPAVRATSGEVVVNGMLSREGHHRSGKVVGVDSSYFDVMNLALASGGRFARAHFSAAAPVAIVGQGGSRASSRRRTRSAAGSRSAASG